MLAASTPTRSRAAALAVVGRARDSFVTLGRIAVMSVTAARYLVLDILCGRFPWREFVTQASAMVGVAVVPTLLVTVPFGVIISIQVGSVAQGIGAESFTGAANGLGVIRQGAPLVSALLLAGAVGSAISSDLGARTIREEVEALEVMGISPVRRLVVPRLLATTLVGALLCGVVAFAGVLTGYLFNIVGQGGTPGGYITSLAAFAEPTDLLLALGKAAVFGAIVAVVACYKGLSARGGPTGVADAVNASVVLAVVLLFAVNVVITQVYAVLVPQRIG